MFGYVRPPLKALPQEEAERFQQIYCGLCHTLSERYGQVARFILNYDFTYLAILLSDGDACSICESRCYASPVRKKCYAQSNDALALAADESVILAYRQLCDGVADHKGLKKLKYRAGLAALKRAYRKAAKCRPEFDRQVCAQLARLRELEQEGCCSIDRPADAFAMLLSSAADGLADPVRRRVLSQILYHLGRWVYLIDAADDLKEDAKSGNYNPVALRYELSDGRWTPESRREFAQTLDVSIRMMATAFELWNFGVWTHILQETFYSSLFQVGKAVLDGTYQPEMRGKHRKKNDEEIP